MPTFDRNRTSFPTFAHRRIWANGLKLVPPEISLAGIHGERREAFLDLYNWMADMYADMYENPEAYYIDCEGGDEALHGQTLDQARTSAKYNKQKQRMWKLQELHERTKLPHMLLSRFLDDLRRDGAGFVMEPSVFEKPFMTKLEKYCRYKISEDAFLTMLGRCGLSCVRDEAAVTFSNEKYPLMFDAFAEWQGRILPNRKWKTAYHCGAALNHLDCRIFQPGFKLTFENSQWYMSDEVIRWLAEIADLLSALGLQWKGTRCTGLYCDYKGEQLAWFGMDAYPTFRVLMFRPGSPEMAAFEAEVNQLPNAEEIRAFCLKTLHRCRKCGCRPVPPSQLGCWCEVLGKKVNLCGAWYAFTTEDFDTKSLDTVKTLIEINDRIIKERV